MSAAAAALPYHEPAVETISILVSFLILLNVLDWALDAVLYCGLIGQIFVGIAWGTPGGKLLSRDAERLFVELGYIGLILIVFEGGLSTSFRSLKANLALSVGVAITGIVTPIGLSFILGPLAGASTLQSFAAGAALCSTSLGTTFAVLRASGLSSTRLGVVLTSAAILDDVVGLVMVQIISNLGGGQAEGGQEGSSSFSSVTVIRPVFVSIAFLVVAVVSCRIILRPTTSLFTRWRAAHPQAKSAEIFGRRETAFVLQTALLIGLVVGSSYAGTSNLFAAYIAGSIISWWDSEVPHLPKPVRRAADADAASGPQTSETPREVSEVSELWEVIKAPEAGEKPYTPSQPDDSAATASKTAHIHPTRHKPIKTPSPSALSPPTSSAPAPAPPPNPNRHPATPSWTGERVYEHYYQPALKWILQPFFFASIGFSIPITRLFDGAIVWRGLVYAVLMVFGKILCGLWLVRLPGVAFSPWWSTSTSTSKNSGGEKRSASVSASPRVLPSGVLQVTGTDNTIRPNEARDSVSAHSQPEPETQLPPPSQPPSPTHSPDCPTTTPNPANPLSLYPAAILGLAMVARGEIGFLISSVAESKGVFSGSSNSRRSSNDSQSQRAKESDIFLIVTWAVVLCTIIGPLSVGLLVRRVRRLEAKGADASGSKTNTVNVLGLWGVEGASDGNMSASS